MTQVTAPRGQLNFATEMARALGGHEFVVYYQPIVAIADAAVAGAEALVRWDHPAFGVVLPDAFIPIAEASGLINRVGAWVLGEACCEAGPWLPSELGLAVNVSVLQLTSRNLLVGDIAAALDAAGLAPGQLTLEISETGVVEDVEVLQEVLAPVRELGVRIALDDFGIGSSSLRRLAALPVDVVKIDGWFTERLDGAEGAGVRAVVTALMALSEDMGHAVVAERIETPAQAQILGELGCRYGQGFLYSQAVPSPSLRRLLLLDT